MLCLSSVCSPESLIAPEREVQAMAPSKQNRVRKKPAAVQRPQTRPLSGNRLWRPTEHAHLVSVPSPSSDSLVEVAEVPEAEQFAS